MVGLRGVFSGIGAQGIAVDSGVEGVGLRGVLVWRDAFSGTDAEGVDLTMCVVFCKSQSPHKSVNISYTITDIKNKSTDLCGKTTGKAMPSKCVVCSV